MCVFQMVFCNGHMVTGVTMSKMVLCNGHRSQV